MTDPFTPGDPVVHQIIPSLHIADASGTHTLHARDALRQAGIVSELFVEHVDAPLRTEARHIDELDAYSIPGRTMLMYQLAVGSTLVDRLVCRHEPLLVNYHNLTPASFYWQWAPDWLDAVESGRQQLHRLASKVVHAIAVSPFNERDLLAAGYRSTSVVPPFVDVGTSGGASPDPAVVDGHDHCGNSAGAPHGTRWLFVGKLLPHKAVHELVKAFAAYRGVFDPMASLTIVGGHPVPAYTKAVREYVAALGLADAVHLPGTVDDRVLRAQYRQADVFVCLSDHEGFCFPLLEAMHHDVPVVCADAGALPDTAGDAALVLRDRSAGAVATAVHRVVDDRALRARLTTAGQARVREFDLQRTAERFVDVIRQVWRRLGASRPVSRVP